MKNKFYTLSTILVMSFSAQAQVGIGTATPNPSSMLDVTSTAKGFLMPRMTTTQRTTIASPSGGLQVYDTITKTIWYHDGTVWVNSGINAVEPWFNQATGIGATSNTQNIYQMGNVGIGTTTPNQKLEVAGGIQTFANGGGATAFRAISGTNASPGADLRVQNNVGAGTIGMVSNHPLEFMTNGTVRATVTAAGNVGVGTGTPQSKLHVSADQTTYAGSNDAQIAVGGTDISQKLLLGYNTTSDKGYIQSNHTNVAWTDLIINPNGGNIGIGTSSPSTLLHVNGIITATKIQGPSDSRFKKNIKPIENALEKVVKLGGYTYDWKDASEFPNQTLGKGHDMGVIAQEVEKQFPEAVTTNPDGYKAVSYTELVPALIEAIKTQQTQIDDLKKEVAKLKEQHN